MTGQESMRAEAKLTVGHWATLACLLEVSAPKPGNVHRGADFEDLTFIDFVFSAVAIAPAMDQACQGASVGQTVLSAVRATRSVVQSNTNLGTILLLAPLAMVPQSVGLSTGVMDVLRRLTAEDARQVYEAIRLAQPGGLGRVDQFDVGGDPPGDLMDAMRLAADTDMVARQYAGGFAEVFQQVLPWLVEGQDKGWPLVDAIIHSHVRLMARFPDSLIQRKCGEDIASRASGMAQGVLDAGDPGEEAYFQALADLDFWLRGDHHRRNPGTTADLVAAGLFSGLREGVLRYG